MDIITLEDLKSIAGAQSSWCVSLFMPAHRRGRDTEQDTIRFKNLLGKAEERLQAKGLRSPDTQEILEPARSLLKDSPFWWHQSDGLAAFINSESSRF
ncbi:MAG: hypothetical protein JXB07_05205, partial [Anaerolineae bacterium]|nr:hypothetical protein [Anaerolineae bacterium]